MDAGALLQLMVLGVALAVTVPLLGRWLAAVYDTGQPAPLDRLFLPVEQRLYRWCGIDPDREQRWDAYARSVLMFGLVGIVGLYGLLRLQGHLPLNPTGRSGVGPLVSFNAAVSFVTNTNWQAYAGESTLSHLSQMAGLTVQNFVSAAVGMAVGAAVIRGFARSGSATIGNFWIDTVRSVTRVLLPLSIVLALFLVSQGVIQNLHGLQPVTGIDGTTQVVPGGPVASQIAIKQLGTNGGGFFNANAAHPFENPGPLSNLVQVWAILALPLAFPLAFGRLVGDRRQGRVLLAVMVGLWLTSVLVATYAETGGNSRAPAGVTQAPTTELAGGGWMEGTETRFGAAGCGLWAATTTATSSGSINCQHDSMTAVGGGTAMVNILLGELSPGGVGVGLMGLVVYAVLAVFVAGLMVGRTPEYLGKKIQATEVKLAMLYLLAAPAAILALAAASVVAGPGQAGIANPGPHGLSEVLYAFGSGAGNNGSAFGGLAAGSDWYGITVGLAMLIGRFLLIVPALGLAGSLAAKAKVPVTAGTFPTHTPLFAGLVAGVVLIVAGLTFFPALALGPMLEALQS